jgi:hypothetical protein
MGVLAGSLTTPTTVPNVEAATTGWLDSTKTRKASKALRNMRRDLLLEARALYDFGYKEGVKMAPIAEPVPLADATGIDPAKAWPWMVRQ